LALAFLATPCDRPNVDGVQLIDLEYQPFPVTSTSFEIYIPVPIRDPDRCAETFGYRLAGQVLACCRWSFFDLLPATVETTAMSPKEGSVGDVIHE
jgi:hypothetical protein